MSRVGALPTTEYCAFKHQVLRSKFGAAVAKEKRATGRSAAAFLTVESVSSTVRQEIVSPARTSGQVPVSGVESSLRSLRKPELRTVAFGCVASTMRSSPKSVLAHALHALKRAAAAEVSQRISARLARVAAKVPSDRGDRFKLRCVVPSASEFAFRSMSRRVVSSRCDPERIAHSQRAPRSLQ